MINRAPKQHFYTLWCFSEQSLLILLFETGLSFKLIQIFGILNNEKCNSLVKELLSIPLPFLILIIISVTPPLPSLRFQKISM